MWKHYLVLLKPTLLLGGFRKVESALAFLGFVLLLLNKPLGQRVLNMEGISSWWAATPIAIVLVHACLKVEYTRFRRLEAQLAEARDLVAAATPSASNAVVNMVRLRMSRMARDAREHAELVERFQDPNDPQTLNNAFEEKGKWVRELGEMLGLSQGQRLAEIWEVAACSNTPLEDTLRLLSDRIAELRQAVRNPRDIEPGFYRRHARGSLQDTSASETGAGRGVNTDAT